MMRVSAIRTPAVAASVSRCGLPLEMEDDSSQHSHKTERGCAASITPFSINDILSDRKDPKDEDEDVQESALDMSKAHRSDDGELFY